MSVSLIKERENKVKVILEKKKIQIDQKAKVNFILDVSGSTYQEFSNGTMQKTVERMYPIATQLTSNNLGMYIFSDSYKVLKDVTISNYSNYVSKEIISKGYLGGGTKFSPFINSVYKKVNGEEFVYNIVLTDGSAWDKPESIRLLQQYSGLKVFWMFIGVGSTDFGFLNDLDNLTGRLNDNADFFSIKSLSDMNDNQLYDRLLQEIPKFLNNFQYSAFSVTQAPEPEPKKTWWQKLLYFLGI